MAAIVVTYVTKTLKSGLKALDDVSFEVSAGGSCALIGPTGSGKSTLLRLIARLDTPDAGTVEIGARHESLHVFDAATGARVDAPAS